MKRWIAVCVLFALSTLGAGSDTSPAPSGGIVLWLITEDGCAPCKGMESAIQAERASGRLQASVQVVNATHDPKLAEWLNGGPVTITPTLILFRPTGRLVGCQPAETVQKFIREH